MRQSYSYILKAGIIAIASALLLSSCRTTRVLNDHEYLLTRNDISFTGKNPGISSEELSSIAKPRQNKKFLGMIRAKLYFYYLGTKGNPDKKFRTWLREKVGERPAVYDSAATLTSAKDMELYLNKVGYFYSDVTPETIHKGKKKVHVEYTVTPSVPYRLKTVNYVIGDTAIVHFIINSKTEPKVKAGDIYNAYYLDDERDRITEILQNNGYYYFNRDFVYYEIDSALQSKEMNVSVRIRPNKVVSPENPSLILSEPHKRYFINKVFIRTNYDPTAPPDMVYDTTLFTVFYRKSTRPLSNYYIIHNGPLKVDPSTIAQSVFIVPGSPFKLEDIKKTRTRITELGLFSYNNIKFREIPAPDTVKYGLLDCNIDLSRRKLHAFTVETEATNSGGRPGIGLNFTYQNSNIFRGAEILRLKARVALEAQKVFGNDAQYSSEIAFFNTIEAGFQVSIDFPKFLIPVKQERFPKYFRPKTTVSVSFGYENRPEYERWVTNFSFGYDWKESERKRHQFFPFDWSLVNVALSPEFAEELAVEPNDRIKSQYTDNIIMGMRYSYTYTTQDIRKIQNFFYFRGNVQTSGNLLQAGYLAFNGPTDSIGNYQMFGITYSQFFKIDGDFRLFNLISKSTSLAYRVFVGTAIPYGNSDYMPLEAGFYGGGSNGMRGWQYRLLGPGSYSNPEDDFDRMGDIQLECNVEYRFPVYSFIKSAIFADIGNVWLLTNHDSYPGGEFKFDRFFREFAIDVGIGLRLDFDFFILRVDFAIPLVDPAKATGDRLVVNKWQLNDFIINFGIGYPF